MIEKVYLTEKIIKLVQKEKKTNSSYKHYK